MDKFHIRFVPLGGITDVTMNMYLYEIYKNDSLEDIIIVDCGVGFPKEQDLGIDLIIPDISYLADKKEKIKAILLTHGHEDHISGLSYHYNTLGMPPIYTAKLTAHFIESKFKEFKIKGNINIIDYDQTYQFGNFKAQFIQMTHSIPDPMHIFINTPIGNFYHGSDYKFDLTPPFGPGPDFTKICKLAGDGVLCLMSDCLGVEREGYTMSETNIGTTFEDLMRKTKGKFIMTTFSSNISRIRLAAAAAVKFNRKICFLGRSMKQNVKIAQSINYFPIPRQFIIKDEEISKYPPDKICLIVAGSQGQYDSALSKITNDLNANVKISKGDLVLFSSDPIPGNEAEVSDIIDRLYLKGADVIYPGIQEQLHASGHGSQEDLKLMIRLTKPQYLIPIGGTVRYARGYRRLAGYLCYHENKVLLLINGQTVTFDSAKYQLSEKISIKNVYVDAYGIGDVGNIVLRDRSTLGKEGIVFVIIPIGSDNKLIRQPELISRGFVYEAQSSDLFVNATATIKEIIAREKTEIIARENLEREIIKKLENLFYKTTGRRPLVIVEILVI